MKGILFLFLILGLVLGIPKGYPQYRPKEKTLFVDQDLYAKKVKYLSGEGQDHFLVLSELLKKSALGRELWHKAEVKALEEGKNLLGILYLGQGSFTDTALVRRYSLSDPHKVKIELRSKISINGELSLLDGVLDLAHELTHYILRGPFDPYGSDFSLESFIRNTVEGEGGEVDAYINECRVLFELFPNKSYKNYHCHKIIDPQTETISRSKALEQFYKVGNYFQEFQSILRKNGIVDRFPLLNEDQSVFISSAYSVPYPVAAYAEFKMVREKSCANDETRLKMMKESIYQIHPSNKKFAPFKTAMLNLEKSYFSRCETN